MPAHLMAMSHLHVRRPCPELPQVLSHQHLPVGWDECEPSRDLISLRTLMGCITLPGHPWGQQCQLLLSHQAFPAALGDPGHRWGQPDRLHPKSRTAMRSLGLRWHHGSVVVALCHPPSVTHLRSVSARCSGQPTGTLQPLGTRRATFTGESTFTL